MASQVAHLSWACISGATERVVTKLGITARGHTRLVSLRVAVEEHLDLPLGALADYQGRIWHHMVDMLESNKRDKSVAWSLELTKPHMDQNAPSGVGGLMPGTDPTSTTSPTATTAGSHWVRSPSGQWLYGETPPTPSSNQTAVRSESQPGAVDGPSARCDWCQNRLEGCAFCRPSRPTALGPTRGIMDNVPKKEVTPRATQPTKGALQGESTSPPCNTK